MTNLDRIKTLVVLLDELKSVRQDALTALNSLDDLIKQVQQCIVTRNQTKTKPVKKSKVRRKK